MTKGAAVDPAAGPLNENEANRRGWLWSRLQCSGECVAALSLRDCTRKEEGGGGIILGSTFLSGVFSPFMVLLRDFLPRLLIPVWFVLLPVGECVTRRFKVLPAERGTFCSKPLSPLASSIPFAADRSSLELLFW